MKRSMAALGLALFGLLVSPAFAGAANDVARGHGTIFTTQAFDFNAQSNFNGTLPSGKLTITFTNTDPNLKYVGDVTCLSVIDNKAAFSGNIKSVNPQRAGETSRSYFAVAEDNDKPGDGKDQFAYTFLGTPPPPPPSCTAFQLTAFPIDNGDIIVNDVLG